jgi:hypothetical protein
MLDYALDAHPAALAHATIVREEVQIRRALAASAAFALGRLDIVRGLSPLIEPARGDWRLSLKMAVAALPMPLAKAAQRVLVAANKRLAAGARSRRRTFPPHS